MEIPTRPIVLPRCFELHVTPFAQTNPRQMSMKPPASPKYAGWSIDREVDVRLSTLALWQIARMPRMEKRSEVSFGRLGKLCSILQAPATGKLGHMIHCATNGPGNVLANTPSWDIGASLILAGVGTGILLELESFRTKSAQPCRHKVGIGKNCSMPKCSAAV